MEKSPSNHLYCYHTSIPTQPHQSIPPHPQHNIPPQIYPIIPPRQVCLCPNCTSDPKYSTYVVPHYPHITPLGYLHAYSGVDYPPMCCLLIRKKRSEYRKKKMNRKLNKQKKKRKLSMSRRDGVNRDLVLLSVDGSREELGRQKGISFFFSKENPLLI